MLLPHLEYVQAARVNGIIHDVPVVGISCSKGHSDLRHLLQLRWQWLFLLGGPATCRTTLEMGNGHLCDWWTNTCENDPMEPEAPEVLWRSGNLGVGNVLRGLHIQGQSLHPRERNHLTTILDLHKDHLGLSGSVACLGLRGKLEIEVGFTPGGGLYVRSFIHEAQSHQGGVRIIKGLRSY